MLVDGVDVCGEPVEDASEGSGLKQPGVGGETSRRVIYTKHVSATKANVASPWSV